VSGKYHAILSESKLKNFLFDQNTFFIAFFRLIARGKRTCQGFSVSSLKALTEKLCRKFGVFVVYGPVIISRNLEAEN